MRNGTRARGTLSRGFTLIELLIVVALIGILATIALPVLKDAPKKAKEAVLRSNLHTLRDVLDQYYADKQRCAASLDTLVEEGYLRKIPEDPMTGSDATWVTEPCQGEDADLTALQGSEDDFQGSLGGPGIWDVHSGSGNSGLAGTPYSEW
jgi:general secretion pathway protein G